MFGFEDPIVLYNRSLHDFRLPPRSRLKCALLSYYAARSGNFLPTFRDNLSDLFLYVNYSGLLRSE